MGSFGTSLAHYANSSIPRTAQMPKPAECSTVPEVCFTNMYPIEKHFKHLLWEKNANWGDHTAISGATFKEFQGNFFGMFRNPQKRMWSSWKQFGAEGEDAGTYGEKIRGVSTKMLAGQAYGLQCTWERRWGCEKQMIPDTPTALKRLDGFKFVGLTEEWDLSICLFHAMFGGECEESEFANMRPSKRSKTD